MKKLMPWVALAVMCFVALVVASSFAPAQTVPGANIPIVITTLADLTGNGATQQVAATGVCRWVQFVALPSNAAAVRVGDSNTTVSRGVPIAAGGGYVPPVPTNTNYVYTLATLYFYAASGDKVSVSCGN